MGSCGKAIKKVFGARTPHEAYAEVLDDKDLDRTPEGRAWLAAAVQALAQPHRIEVPYKQVGYFAPDKPRALGLQFNAGIGQRLTFTVDKNNAAPVTLFADVYAITPNGNTHLLAADTALNEFYFDVPQTGTYTLRLQPQLYQSGNYRLAVAVGPSLSFPASHSKAKAGSFWGASRDGGKRSHEGVDIFAPKGSPAVAAADGIVTGVNEGGIGGKVVWLRPHGKSYTLYYAHLDDQLVQPGQQVKAGDILGTVGNTGNARNTPAHLHFGIYTFQGAIDPWPFVNKAVKTAGSLPDKNITGNIILTKTVRTHSGATLPAQTTVVPLAFTNDGYVVESATGERLLVPATSARLQPPNNTVVQQADNKKGPKKERRMRG